EHATSKAFMNSYNRGVGVFLCTAMFPKSTPTPDISEKRALDSSSFVGSDPGKRMLEGVR
ncbi:MAG: hypothetical protein ABUK19_04305, partial [Desulfobacteria bacterium]